MNKAFARAIRARMAEVGCESYRDLAERTGLSANGISKICNNGNATTTSIRLIAEALSTTPASLYLAAEEIEGEDNE